MIKWINENDGYVSNSLDVNKAIKHIKNDELLIKIPEKLILNVSKFWEIPNIYKWISHDNDKFLDDDINKLVVLLIYEKHLGSKSFYYPYISSLPLLIDFKDYAICNITEDNMEMWKEVGFFFNRKIQNYQIIIYNITEKIIELNNIHLIINLEKSIFNATNTSNDILKSLVIWAYIIYYNKSFDKNFIPYINLFKHNEKLKIEDQTADSSQWLYHSPTDVSDGDEIYFNYNYTKDYFYDNKDIFYLNNYTNFDKKYMNI